MPKPASSCSSGRPQALVTLFMLSWLCMPLVVTSTVWAKDVDEKEVAWRYGAMLDLSYAINFNFPENHLWRSKATTPRTGELAPNLGLVYIRKNVTARSPWGAALAIQGGYDTQDLVPDAVEGREKPIEGDDMLRRLGEANVSYQFPVGKGLTLTGGIFPSYIGYQSLYAKDNLNYTRSYMADRAPYIMMGLAATYPVNDQVSAGVYVINGYTHLSHVNDQPSYGTQVVWKTTPKLTVTENLYAGPDQRRTDLRFWRYFSDTIVEWKDETWTLAGAYDIGTEQASVRPGHPQTFWMGGALYARRHLTGPWSVALRPEFYWDRDARLTGSEQFISAITSTLEYRRTLGHHTTVFRLEHRYDESRGPGGGFYRGRALPTTGEPALVPEQHLLFFSVIWAYDS